MSTEEAPLIRTITLFLAVFIALGSTGCSDMEEDSTLVGGWRGGDNGPYACFSADNRMSLGDQLEEIKISCCIWSDEGRITLPDGTGSWSIKGSELILSMDPGCSGEGCGPNSYYRDDSLPCFWRPGS